MHKLEWRSILAAAMLAANVCIGCGSRGSDCPPTTSGEGIVTSGEKTIAKVERAVDGKPAEDTFDWFALVVGVLGIGLFVIKRTP